MKSVCVVYTFRMNQHCQWSKYAIDIERSISIGNKEIQLVI